MALWAVLKATFKEFNDDNCPSMAASLSYATVFALPPLLMLLFGILGVFVDPGDLRGRVLSEMQGLLGEQGAQMIGSIINQSNKPGTGVMAVIGVVILIVGATGAFGQLQQSLNTAWGVKPDPAQGGIKSFIGKRLLSFGMILVIGFMLLISFVIAALISALGGLLRSSFGDAGQIIAQIVQTFVGLGVAWLLFGLMFKYMPDAEISWKDVGFGALVTSVLFTIGRFAIGLYLGHSTSPNAFGAAAALAVLLIWIYYAALILLIGAEFTQVWARRHGREIEPEAGAVRVVVKEVKERNASRHQQT